MELVSPASLALIIRRRAAQRGTTSVGVVRRDKLAFPVAVIDPPKRVIAVSARFGARTELVELKKLLERAAVPVTLVASLDEAATQAGGEVPAECLILDASFATELKDDRLNELLGGALARLRAAVPALPVVVAAAEPPATFLGAAFRAGAADVLDLETIDQPSLHTSLRRAAAEHKRRLDRTARIDELRGIVEQFLRELVRAEKRALELEEQLAPEEGEGDVEGAPRVLVVDDEAAITEMLTDHLARLGLSVEQADSGEQAVERMRESKKWKQPIDLALVDKNLPGMNGIELITKLRELVPSLPTVMMTGYSDEGSAMAAADLGVVGYVLKPFDDVRELALRVKDAAARFAAERRQRRHLARIKQRHKEFLERYRRIATELDRLKE
jgi:CheY-like chemotaxis protein